MFILNQFRHVQAREKKTYFTKMRAPRVQSTVVLPLFWHHHFDNLTIQEINISAVAIAVLGRLVPISNFYALDIFGLSVVSLSYGQFWLPPGARTGRSETASAEIGAKMLTMPFKLFKVLSLHLHAKLLLSTLNHILVYFGTSTWEKEFHQGIKKRLGVRKKQHWKKITKYANI